MSLDIRFRWLEPLESRKTSKSFPLHFIKCFPSPGALSKWASSMGDFIRKWCRWCQILCTICWFPLKGLVWFAQTCNCHCKMKWPIFYFSVYFHPFHEMERMLTGPYTVNISCLWFLLKMSNYSCSSPYFLSSINQICSTILHDYLFPTLSNPYFCFYMYT